jgi:hypothetical protein
MVGFCPESVMKRGYGNEMRERELVMGMRLD